MIKTIKVGKDVILKTAQGKVTEWYEAKMKVLSDKVSAKAATIKFPDQLFFGKPNSYGYSQAGIRFTDLGEAEAKLSAHKRLIASGFTDASLCNMKVGIVQDDLTCKVRCRDMKWVSGEIQFDGELSEIVPLTLLLPFEFSEWFKGNKKKLLELTKLAGEAYEFSKKYSAKPDYRTGICPSVAHAFNEALLAGNKEASAIIDAVVKALTK